MVAMSHMRLLSTKILNCHKWLVFAKLDNAETSWLNLKGEFFQVQVAIGGLRNRCGREFFGDPVVRILGFHCHVPGWFSGQITEILQAEQHSPPKN